jgi:hypothetical protein
MASKTATFDRLKAAVNGAEGTVTFSVDSERGVASAPELRSFLCAGHWPSSLTEVRIERAVFEASLDLSGISLGMPLRFVDCSFPVGVVMDGAALEDLLIDKGDAAWISATDASIRRSFRVHDCTVRGLAPNVFEEGAGASIRLTGLSCGGDLSISGPVGAAINAYAIRAGYVKVGRNVRLVDLDAMGEVAFVDAAVGGEFVTGPTRIESVNRSLRVSGAHITGSLWLGRSRQRRLDSFGVIEAQNTQIGGIVRFDDAHLSNEAKRAFDGERIVATSVYVDHGCSCIGEFHLANSRIASDVEFDSFSIVAPGTYALNLGGAHIGGRVKAGGLRLVGSLRINNANVSGTVVFSDLEVSKPVADWGAVIASGCTVGSEFILRRAISGQSLNFDGVTISGTLDLRGLRVDCGTAVALSVYGSTIGRDLRLDSDNYSDLPAGCNAGGSITSTITGDLHVENTKIKGTLSLEGLDLIGNAIISNGESTGGLLLSRWAVSGKASLAGFRTTALDDSVTRWPLDVDLSGFRYERFGNSSATSDDEDQWDCRARIAWLARGHVDTSAYSHLADVYRSHGRNNDADRVMMALQARSSQRSGAFGRLASPLQRALTGYGYRLGRLGFLLALVVVGMWAYVNQSWARERLVARTSAGATITAVSDRCAASTCYNPALFAVDTVIPLVDLDQRRNWHADGHQSGGNTLEWVLGLATVMGWTLSSVFLLSFARLNRAE